MKLWKNTSTLDSLIPDLANTVDAAEAEIAIIGSKPIDLDQMPELRGIFKCGIGVDNVPFQKAADHGVKICLPSEATKEFIYEETASFSVHLIFRSLYSNVGNLNSWKKFERDFLGHRKVLVLGQGNIGKRVKDKLLTCVDVLTYDILQNPQEDLKGLFSQADVVTIHIPLNDSTRCFIDGEKLSWMPSGSTIINTARGPIVDEDALFVEISAGRIRGAFDVFWEEPYRGRLSTFHPERFFMTPHVASNCKCFLTGLVDDFREFYQSFA